MLKCYHCKRKIEHGETFYIHKTPYTSKKNICTDCRTGKKLYKNLTEQTAGQRFKKYHNARAKQQERLQDYKAFELMKNSKVHFNLIDGSAKIGYKSLQAANIQILKIKNITQDNYRAYLCPLCDEYHLTKSKTLYGKAKRNKYSKTANEL